MFERSCGKVRIRRTRRRKGQGKEGGIRRGRKKGERREKQVKEGGVMVSLGVRRRGRKGLGRTRK